MRRKDRGRDRQFALEVIDRCEYGVAAFATGEEEPYCLPLSLVRVGEVLYFHCALEGKKLSFLRRDPRICITFVGKNQAATDQFTTYFQSAMVTGEAFEVTDAGEKTEALRALCQKLTPANMERFDRAIAKSLSVTGVWGIRMDDLVGKEKAKP